MNLNSLRRGQARAGRNCSNLGGASARSASPWQRIRTQMTQLLTASVRLYGINESEHGIKTTKTGDNVLEVAEAALMVKNEAGATGLTMTPLKQHESRPRHRAPRNTRTTVQRCRGNTRNTLQAIIRSILYEPAVSPCSPDSEYGQASAHSVRKYPKIISSSGYTHLWNEYCELFNCVAIIFMDQTGQRVTTVARKD